MKGNLKQVKAKNLISVIIPVYNAGKYLERCLDSVINQSYNEIEIIIINDGSNDNSENIILSYLKKDKRIKHFKQSNQGQATARNFGLSKAVGEYISFVDADDWVENIMLEQMYYTLIKSNADICMCGLRYCYKKRVNEVLPTVINNKKEALIDVLMPSPCNKLYKSSILKRIKFLEGKIKYEDLYFNMLAYLAAKKIVHLNEIYYNYDRTNETSTISTIDRNVLDILEVLENGNNFYKKQNRFKAFYEELEYINIYTTIGSKIPSIYSIKDDLFQKDACDKITNFLTNNFKDWSNNKYLYRLNFKQKLIFNLFRKRQYLILKILLFFK